MYVFVISIIVDACVAKDRQRETAAAGEEKRRGEAGGGRQRTWGGVSAQSLQETESGAVCGCHKRVWLRGGAREEREKRVVFEARSLDCDAA